MLFTNNLYNWSTSDEAASSISVIDDYPKLRARLFSDGFKLIFLLKYHECLIPKS